MRAKETLQLRHQLSASGLSLRAAAYDTRRHHVLTFDAHPLRPHVLRLFSLRRELKSVALFDPEVAAPQAPVAAPQGRKSLFELQQHPVKLHEAIVPLMLLQYSSTLDVFVCAYSRSRRPKGSSKVPSTSSHYVLLLEPATLRKLLKYEAPGSHLLQCCHFDPLTDRLALASHLNEQEQVGQMLPSAPENVVEILQLSKKQDDQTWRPTGATQELRTLLVIENTRASLRHPDNLQVLCASRGMRELFGAAGDAEDETGTLLEWRQHEMKGNRFVLVRRVMIRERVTAMALSPCGDWLLAGFCRGGLKVWSVNGSRTNGLAQFTIDEDPYEPAGENISEAQTEVISSIEIATTPARDSCVVAAGAAELIVIVAGRDTGDVRHWKFSVERKMFGNEDSTGCGEHRYPRLSLVGYFHAGGKDQMGKEESPRKLQSQDTLGPPLKTLTLCVTVDMGSCFENLLLVVREDVIHVLKVQTVLYVMQEFAAIEEAYAVRAIGQQDESKLCSLSSTAACKLRIFPLDDTRLPTEFLFISSQASAPSAHVSAMETLTNDCTQISFVVLAWSNGIVDVYDVQTERPVLKLHDSQLHVDDQVCALSVVAYQHALVSKKLLSGDEATEAGFLSYRSFIDNHTTDPTTCRTSNDSAEDASQTRKTLIVVGTESGKLFGWNADVLWGDILTFKSVGKANVRVRNAHSSHIVHLACFGAEVRGKQALMGSVGAGGIIKLWKIPSLKMVGYINNVVEGFPVTPSCLELMKGQSTNAVEAPQYVSVGYEDGRLAVWLADLKRESFQSLKISAKHERRVSKICRVSSELVPTGLTEFLSCSLDMTVIQWQIAESGNVHEKRYFDIGAAIVDMILVKEQAVVTLAHEVCKFAFAPCTNSDVKYLVKTGTIGETRSEADKPPSEHADVAPSDDDDEYPNTPTTRSIDDSTEGTILSHQTSRSVDEYLTLHVPSAVLHLEAGSSSVVAPETTTDSAPVSRASEQDESLFRSPKERSTKVLRYRRESKNADKLQRPLVNDKDLREYLQDYIARHGSGGTMAANRMTHLLALRPELPSVKRPGFALAKSLKDLKLSGQTRVDSEEALDILKMLFAVSTISNQSMTQSRRQQDKTTENARAQRIREKRQARRRPVVTYNLLGEKYVKWEETCAEQDATEQNQLPPSPSNSLVVHTPPSPKMRDATNFNDALSSIDATRFSDMKAQHFPRSTATVDADLSESSSVGTSGAILHNFTTPLHTPPDEKSTGSSVSADPSQHNLSEEEEDSEDDGVDSDEEGDESENENETDDEHSNESDTETAGPDQGEMTLAAPTKVTRATISKKKSPLRKQTRKLAVSSNNISENALVNGIHVSPMFQQFWTKGYCWCRPAPRLHIVWSRKGEAKTNDKTTKDFKARGARRKEKCEVCHKYLHTVELSRAGYAPHFSRQATFGIIVDVYAKLTASAHSRLYKTASPIKERSPECSIFSALFEVFLATYGMRSTVEMKLKLFFVSMCHFLRECDAIAVFGELLGLHMPDNSDEDDQAPSTLVALCVCCYAWLYSRGMVVNGDAFSGRLRGQRGNSYESTNTEITPATDGATHWQFVRVEHALLCAQDNLLYPLVSPGFLRNIMLFMQEYAQRLPTRSLRTDSPDFNQENKGNGPALWIELHRFLRLLVGEWKQQNSEFRVVERLLFLYPQRDAAIEGDLVEKLRLMLSCFVFYDHDRVGAMAISDFEGLVYKLRYLWVDGRVKLSLKDTEFDKAMLAIKSRFADLNHDGQLCYLDFWTMLYIVGVKTRGLIHFHELPSFCKDYRLEVSQELSDMVWNYMQLSCTLLLPNGLQVGKSSMDQKAERQHRRRVGGLHDGTFHFAKTLKGSLSTQELLASDDTKTFGLFLDGTMPAARQTASTTALDRFRPVSVDGEMDANGSSRLRGRKPIVVGVRRTGPTPKPVAPIRVSFMGNFDRLPETDMITGNDKAIREDNLRPIHGNPSAESATAYTNMYIQFPQVAPVRRRVGSRLPHEITVYSARQTTRSISMDDDNDEGSIVDSTMNQEGEEEEQVEIASELARTLSARTLANMPPLGEELPIEVDQPASPKPTLEKRRSTTASPKPTLEKRRSTTPVVVVPTIETAALLSRVDSRTDLLIRPSSPELQRAVSECVELEETVAQLGPEMGSSRSRESTPMGSIRVESAGDEPPLVIESDQSVIFDDKERNEPDEKPDEESQQVEPDELVPIPYEEAPPEPESVVEIHVEAVVVNEVESICEPDIIPEAVIEVEVVAEAEVVKDDVEVDADAEVVNEDIHIDRTPVEEPPLEMEERKENTEDFTEDVLQPTVSVLHAPQVVKEGEIQIHRAYRFSQQPTFLQSVTVTNNPYRTAMWNPNDDSESDDDEHEMSSEKKKLLTSSTDGLAMDEPVVSSDEEVLTGPGRPKPAALNRQTSHKNLSRVDSNLQPTQRAKRDKQSNPRDYQFSDDMPAIDDEAVGEVYEAPHKAMRRLDDDAERALYGERVVNVLGEGIAFSKEAEVAQQQKWQTFFGESESKMFAPMRHDLEKKQKEQREAEERQRKLRKKWQEQRDQDLLRLQNSRQNSTENTLLSTKNSATNGGVDASFRLRRIHRESCRQLTEELQFGVSVQRELEAVKATEFFHFYYLPEDHGSIITLKMHVIRGDAEVFMSTDTKVPCITDFMWRSSERLAKDSGEGHRIVLYPHDLNRVVTAATANAAPTEQAGPIVERTSSLRSIYPKQPEVASQRVGFYLSVVALEPGTTFTLAVMSSGQKMQSSRALQTVDYLIDRFNMISRSIEGQSFDSTSEIIPPKAVPKREIASRQFSAGIEEDEDEDESAYSDNEAGEGGRHNIGVEDVDPEQLKTFQYLLETLSEKKGFGSPRAVSILLAGPSKEHLEFVQDEDQRLKEMHLLLSPPKSTTSSSSRGLEDAISGITERRLTLQGKRQKLRRVVAARLQQKLVPLRHKPNAGGELEKSASVGSLTNIRVAKTVPRPVAYSLTSLDPLPRSQRFKAAATLPQTRRSSVAEKGTTNGVLKD